jgi:hypothetical protein
LFKIDFLAISTFLKKNALYARNIKITFVKIGKVSYLYLNFGKY